MPRARELESLPAAEVSGSPDDRPTPESLFLMLTSKARATLAQVETVAVEAIVALIQPERMSAVCRRFTLDLLAENRRRLLEPDPS